jgi:hypothetical protein
MKLLDILLEVYKEEYELNLQEGLIKTTNIGKTINLLKKKYSLKFTFTKSKNSFSIKTFSTDINTLLKGIIKDANTLGWFPSFMETEEYTGKWDEKYFKEGEIKLRFEAKFDEEVVENIPSILYHITPTQNSDKILKIGLVPKSRSKASYHPDRVYLSKDLEDIENLGEMFYQKTGIKNWTILKIDTNMIPGGYLRLYTDPNYSKEAYYTLNNIPPQAIEKIKDINI